MTSLMCLHVRVFQLCALFSVCYVSVAMINHAALCTVHAQIIKEKNKKEKTAPLGIHLMRSQVKSSEQACR